MNSTFLFVLMIIAIVMTAGVIQTYIKQRGKDARPDPELLATLERMAQLEERIRVLERIVTENRVDLKQQIDSL